MAADTCQRCRWLVWSVPFVTSQEGRSAQFAKQDVIAKLNVVDCVTARKATVATNMTPREKYTDATTFCGENDDAWQENTVLHRPQEVTQRQFLGQFVQNSRECVWEAFQNALPSVVTGSPNGARREKDDTSEVGPPKHGAFCWHDSGSSQAEGCWRRCCGPPPPPADVVNRTSCQPSLSQVLLTGLRFSAGSAVLTSHCIFFCGSFQRQETRWHLKGTL